uniref:hypothetical protein n=1 Tax=Nocardioides jensenii TaxID=1843 RepID=UPI000A44ABBC
SSNDPGNTTTQDPGSTGGSGTNTDIPGAGTGGANQGGSNNPEDDIPNTGTPADEPAEQLWTRAEALVACTNEVLKGVTNPLGLDLTQLLTTLNLMDDRDQCVTSLANTPK